MAKAAEAFRTISEVADDLGIQKHVLRFWEVKFSQIRPMKRGGGRRYYRPEDMELLRGIRQLLHKDGYTIKGVQKILREQGVEAVKQRVLEEAAAAAAREQAAAGGATATAAEGDAGGSATNRRLKGRGKGAAVVVDRKQVLLAAIAELTRCRDMLTGKVVSAGEVVGKPQARTRRTA